MNNMIDQYFTRGAQLYELSSVLLKEMVDYETAHQLPIRDKQELQNAIATLRTAVSALGGGFCQ